LGLVAAAVELALGVELIASVVGWAELIWPTADDEAAGAAVDEAGLADD
jgi:hypothetical protein